jgi:hypothetical protein
LEILDILENYLVNYSYINREMSLKLSMAQRGGLQAARHSPGGEHMNAGDKGKDGKPMV